MPRWGLTEEQRRSAPWGITEDWLLPDKTITDPVHGDIHVNRLERRLLDSPPLQRLRRVRQLGTTHLVYPGATHSRFSHVLGTLRAAQDLLDAVAGNMTGPRGTEGLLHEWRDADEFDCRFAEATILARLGALLHDLGHVPMGHTIEDDLEILYPHDANRERFDALWSRIDAEALEVISAATSQVEPERRLFDEVLPLVLSKLDTRDEAEDEAQKEGPPKARAARTAPPYPNDVKPPELYPFVEDIVGNTICADLLDYIRRDHLSTGLPLATGTRFTADFYVRQTSDWRYQQRMVIRVVRKDRLRPDIVSELLKYLRYRYELSERALAHPTKLAADTMLGVLMHSWKSVLAETFADADDPKRAVREALESEFTRRSDDGLLEHLAMLPVDDEPLGEAVHELADAILHRRLYKEAGHARDRADRDRADSTFARFGKHNARAVLCAEACRFAGFERPWHLMMWVPSPEMRLKVAEVLVDDGTSVKPLDQYDDDARAIAAKHRELWSVNVYVHPNIPRWDARRDLALWYLRKQMQVDLRTPDGSVPRTPDEIFAEVIGPLMSGAPSVMDVSGSASDGTFRDILDAGWDQLEASGRVQEADRPDFDGWWHIGGAG